MSEKIEKMQLISVVPSDMYVDCDHQIWRLGNGTPPEDACCVVCSKSMSIGTEPEVYDWFKWEDADTDFAHQLCVRIIVPAEAVEALNNVGKSAEEMMLDLTDDEGMYHPAGEDFKTIEVDIHSQDITWLCRPLILIRIAERAGMDTQDRQWAHVQFDSGTWKPTRTCEICGKELVNNEGVWIKEVNDYLNQICELCVVIVEATDVLDAYLEKHHIPKRCQNFETCSQHCEVVKDYHMRSGDLLYRDYRCLVCDRTWFATYRAEQEIDTETEEVYIDHT